jgi:hypothetical protein
MTLRRYRIVPSTPPSLVKLARRDASLRTGASSSTPTSDQVPHEIYANCSDAAGTPTTADAVSCEPTATTSGLSGTPRSASTGPITVPGWRSGGKSAARMPNSAMSGAAHSPVRRSSSCVVDALVTSVPSSPVSQYAMRSGISRSCWATSMTGVPAAATSWYSVLNGCRCSPVIAYSLSSPIVAATRSATPSVRESR